MRRRPSNADEYHHASQQLPSDWNKRNVVILGASNFRKVAYDHSKDVCVLFYAPWCEYSRELEVIFDKLGKMYRERSDVVIAKFDGSVNELPILITGYPTVKLFRKGDNQVFDYTGSRTLGGLVDFIDFIDFTGGEGRSELSVQNSTHSRRKGCRCVIL
ncbi:hypothetical protein O3M35_011137 [Rhynocoris fuscipes]|uniref:Thioredoxin domain-containing protein n=1 Tax=Rhynocoris fuscipes TaxID=488301 RepID=A0AAW1D0D8_9HEMI